MYVPITIEQNFHSSTSVRTITQNCTNLYQSIHVRKLEIFFKISQNEYVPLNVKYDTNWGAAGSIRKFCTANKNYRRRITIECSKFALQMIYSGPSAGVNFCGRFAFLHNTRKRSVCGPRANGTGNTVPNTYIIRTRARLPRGNEHERNDDDRLNARLLQRKKKI